MIFKHYIGIFKDKSDLEIILSDDKIINITGMMGSGKTTLAKKIKQENNIEFISLDWLFGASLKNRPEYIKNILISFKNDYPELKNRKEYYEYADKIYNYLLKNISNPIIYEGRHIYRYIDINVLKGKIIIKRTSLIHSYKRALKRDMNNKIKEYKNKEVKINAILNRLFERIKIPFKDYIMINKYIKKISEKYYK